MAVNSMGRRTFIRALGALGVAASGISALAACDRGAQGQSGATTIRISHDEPPHMLTHRLLTDMASRIEKKTDGDVKLEISPGAQLSGGDIETMIQQTQAGGRLDASLIASGIYSNFASEVDIFSMPFLARDIDDLKALADSAIGDKVKELTIKNGLVTRDIWVRDLRQWVNGTREIRTPGDMKGLAFRVPQFPLWLASFTAVGAAATPMPFGEAFTAVQTGAIDGAERPTEFLVGEGWEDVADYVTLSNYAGDVLLFSFNEQSWNDLPKDVQNMLDTEIAAMGQEKFEQEKAQRSQFVEQMKSAGMKIHELTEQEHEAFRNAMSTVWSEWEGKLPQGWLKQAQQIVARD